MHLPPSFRRAAAPLLAILVLSACAGPGGPPAACRVDAVAILPLVSTDGHPVVEANVNDRKLEMLLDTGAEISVVTRAVVTRLGLQLDPRRSSFVSGLGGTVRQEVAPATVALAGRGRQVDLPVVDLPSRPNMRVLDGVVGVDVMSDYDVELDMAAGRLGLYQVSGCDGGYAPWQGRYTRLPAAITPRQRVLVPVRIAGLEVNAMIDSGAERTVLSPDVARRAGVTDEQFATAPVITLIGAALRPVLMRQLPFMDVQVGAERFTRVEMAVPGTPLPGVNMLLGSDYLARHRVWISFANHVVFVQPSPPR